MPITINGSGTVTGVSVGGLPDGIVDTDMIANSNVTAAKLASGVGGKILQVKEKLMTGSFTTTSTSYSQIAGIEESITLSNSSNKVFVLFKGVNTVQNNSNTSRRVRAQLYRGSVSSGTVIDYQLTGSWGFSGSGYTYDHSSVILMALDEPGATSVTYNVGAQRVDSSGGLLEFYGGAEGGSKQTRMLLVEIAP